MWILSISAVNCDINCKDLRNKRSDVLLYDETSKMPMRCHGPGAPCMMVIKTTLKCGHVQEKHEHIKM